MTNRDESKKYQEKARAFSWRRPTEEDLPACLEVQPAYLGDELTGPEIAREVWKGLLKHPATVAAVFECEPPIGGRSVSGFGAGVFVTPEFADAELARPRPYIGARIIESIHAGRSVLLTPSEIARSNAGGGLDIAQLCAAPAESILSAGEYAHVMALLPASLGRLLAGYRMNRMFGEAIGREMRESRAASLFLEVAAFPELNRVINLMSPEVIATRPLSVANLWFQHRKPLLGLTGAEQDLLWAALEGQTDEGLGASLSLTLSAVKARWRNILARFAKTKQAMAPEFFGDGGRGPQKRHRVLAYLREHPEELRPYDPSPAEK